MAFTFTFGNVTTANTSWLDTNFNQAGLLGTIPCTVSGTNTLVLTPYTTPTIGTPTFALQPGVRVQGVVAGTNTGAVTAAVGATGSFPVYKDTIAGPAALSGSELFVGNSFVLTYDQSLNAGGGGWHLSTTPASTAGTVTNVATGSGLTGGPITSTGTIALANVADQRLLSNISGGAAAPSANSLTTILDAIVSSTNGAMLSRGASVWGSTNRTTWTPALALGGGATGMTYGTQTGNFMAIGAAVLATFSIVLTAKGSSTGNLTISLPSTANGSNGGGIVFNYSNFTSVTTIPWLSIASAGTTASLLVAGSATVTNLTDANLANNTALQGVMLYFAV